MVSRKYLPAEFRSCQEQKEVSLSGAVKEFFIVAQAEVELCTRKVQSIGINYCTSL